MPGFLSIESGRTTAASRTTDEALRALLATCAVGILAGLAAGHLRLGLGLPGHKAVVWMAPVIAARLVFGASVGATAAALAAGFAATAVGGHFAGAAMHLPVAALAGGVLDVAARAIERRRLAARWAIPLMGLAGLAANLVMLGKRLLAPLFSFHALLGVAGVWARLASYAAFGLAAGLIGGGAAWVILRRRRT